MADENTKFLLQQWGFENFLQIFEEQDITEEVLLSLTEQNIADLIPTVGKRVLLYKKIVEYKESKTVQLQTLVNAPIIFLPNDEIKTSKIVDSDTPSCSSMSIPSTSSDVSEITFEDAQVVKRAFKESSLPLKSFYGETEFKKACTESYHLNLQTFLEKSRSGRYILNSYSENKVLSKKARNVLAEVIINGIIFDSNRSATYLDFEIISEKICHLFPTECQSTWYIPAISAKISPTNKAVNAKGKLPDKYKNLKKVYTKDNSKDKINTREEEQDTNDTNDTEYSSEELEQSSLWLKHHVDPWSDVEKHWSVTYKLRRNDKSENVAEFLKKWPILKNNRAYLLVENDFCQFYPQASDNLLKTWGVFFDNLKSLDSSSGNDILIQILPDLEDDSSDALKIVSLATLLPPTTRIRKDKNCWKPSVVECQHSIIQHVKIPAEINITIENRRNIMQKFGLPLQPFIIVLGPNICKIEDSYVVIEGVLYKSNSVLHAFDLCFKTFHVLHSNYPPESEHIWLLLQRFVYKINTKWDKKIPTVERVIKDLQKVMV